MKTTTQHQPGEALTDAHQKFVVFVRTKQFLSASMIKGIKPGDPVHITLKEIEQRFFVYPEYNQKVALQQLQQAGEIAISERKSKNGNKMYLYAALRARDLDASLIEPEPLELGKTGRYMFECLQRVSLPGRAGTTPYFNFFLQNKLDFPELFFRMDKFAKRIHTPVTNLKSEYRNHLLIDGVPTIAFDVGQMQPTLLAKILSNEIGSNQFSRWINQGFDIYETLQAKAGLSTRKEAKDRFYQITFAPPSNELAELFGQSNWIDWINHYKRTPNPDNPHDKIKRYSALAWRLQNEEVRIMRRVWRKLHQAGIPFLSVHDEIITKLTDSYTANKLLTETLSDEFENFKINRKGAYIT